MLGQFYTSSAVMWGSGERGEEATVSPYLLSISSQ
jgi:hypothetical protein